MIKLETCKNIAKRAKGVIKEFKHKHMLVDLLKAMQKAVNVNCTLKLPVKTKLASKVISLESVKKKQSSAAQNCCFRRARKKKQQLVRRSPAHSTGRHILPLERSHCKLIKTIAVCNYSTGRFSNLADVCRLFLILIMKF